MFRSLFLTPEEVVKYQAAKKAQEEKVPRSQKLALVAEKAGALE